ncbi:MAG: L-arabinose isomerase, partial [Rhodoglobus sp.]
WLTAGAAHHTVLSTQVGVDVFADFAEIARTELLVIDAETTTRSFARELRWNQAYYRLAQGF